MNFSVYNNLYTFITVQVEELVRETVGKFRVGVELYCVVLDEDRRTDKVTTKEVAQSHYGEQWLASWGLSVVSSYFFSSGP